VKILALSNFYPPHHFGGYEIGFAQVLERLARRGHAVRVLTSTFARPGAPADGGAVAVERVLPLLGPKHRLAGVVRREVRANRLLRVRVTAERPDVAFVGNMSRMPMSLLYTLKALEVPAAYYVSDTWLAEKFHRDPWLSWWTGRGNGAAKRTAKAALRALGIRRLAARIVPSVATPLDLRHAVFASGVYRARAAAAGFPVAGAAVVPWGCDLRRFGYRARSLARRPLRLLAVGYVEPGKGFHVALEAVARVRADHGADAVTLTIVGAADNRPYREALEGQARAHGLTEIVRLRPPVAHDEMPALYEEHDVFLFPAIHEEALSMALVEAMASGLPVISTATGGNAELVQHEVNALVVAAGDADGLAAAIGVALRRPGVLAALAEGALDTVKRRFVLDVSVESLEGILDEAARGR